MEVSLIEPKAEVFVLNDDDEILYKKELTLNTPISEVIKIYSRITTSDTFWNDIQIKFVDIKLLDRVLRNCP